MALIGRIRKNFWFVLLVLGLALAAFVIMDMVNAGNRGGLGPQQVVGEVAGQKIDYMDFQKVEQALFSNSQDNLAAKSSVWNYLVERAIVDKQAESIGLGVTRDELMDLQFGTNLSPVIQNTFRNPQTGQVDMQQLLNIKQTLEGGEELSPTFRLSWSEQEKQIKKTAKQDKLTTMVSKAMFTPSFFVEASEKNNSATASFDYVKIAFDNISDSEVTVTDADISEYIKENAAQYTAKEELRKIAYVVKDVLPTSADSALWREQVANLATQFGKNAAGQDSIWVINNQGQYSPIYATLSDLPEPLQAVAEGMENGEVYGPYLDNGAYFAVKLIDKRVYPDSVTVSHILRGVTAGDAAQTAAATTYLDSLERLVRSGSESISSLAATNSQDQSSMLNEGSLGTFPQASRISLEFSKKAFEANKGDIYRISSTFGEHLVQVTDQIYNDRNDKYRYAYVRVPITPSENTQDIVFDDVQEIVDQARDIASLQTIVDSRNDLSLETAPAVRMNDFSFGPFGSGNTSRDIIKWAYDQDTEIGEVSPTIYTYTDEVNYFNSKYVIAVLKSVSAPGLAKPESVREEVEIAVTNWKKGKMLAEKVSGSDLSAIASQYGTSVESATDVRFSNSTIAGIGNEPKVLAAAFAQEQGSVSSPIRGNNGVYVIKTNSKTDGAVSGNIPASRRTLTSSARSRAPFSLMSALKDIYKPEDNRYKFF